MASDQDFEASVDLYDEDAYRTVVDDFRGVRLRCTGTKDEHGDGIDIPLSTTLPREDAVVELIDGDRVLCRLIQRNDGEQSNLPDCPACGSVLIDQSDAPYMLCNDCKLVFWQEGSEWYCCGEDGDTRRVESGGESDDE